MAKKKMCKKCGENPAVVNYCTPCMKYVSRMMDRVMDNARAARCLARATNASEREKVGWFLGIFHPEMSDAQVHKVMQAVKD